MSLVMGYIPLVLSQMQQLPSSSTATIELIIYAIALLLIITCSASSLWRLYRRFIKAEKLLYRRRAERYHDKDGIATKESEAAYSYHLQKVLILLLSAVGSLDSFVLAVIATQSSPAIVQWLRLVSWVCVN
jgi:hypothetical protein